MALGGLALVLWGALRLPEPGEPFPGWLWHAFVGWCVGVPYWHYLEYRLLLDPAADERARIRFTDLQCLSRTVWAAAALVLGVALLLHRPRELRAGSRR